MRVLVCGGRDYDDIPRICEELDKLHSNRRIEVVIAGGARGADFLAANWASMRAVRKEIYPADWDMLGRRAGPIRNQQMLDKGKPDLVVVFPGGRGTADMVRRARAAGVEISEIQP